MGIELIRREYEVTSRSTEVLALVNHLINGLESLMAEYGCRNLLVEGDEVGPLLRTSVSICASECEEFPTEGFELELAKKYGLIRDYSFTTSCNRGISLRSLYGHVRRLAERELVSILKSYALRTAFEGVEYMLVVLQNGRALILEGEVNKVTIPLVKATASLHTHPRGCVPSPHDIRSSTHVFLDGGLVAGITSPQCSLLIFRSGPFTEEDYLGLIKFKDMLGDEDVDSIRSVISKGVLGPNLLLVTVT